MVVTVPSFAKLNLDLRVLHKRPDGFHELRTVFQTISLRDSLTIEWKPAKRTQIELDCSFDIPDNLVVRAAKAVLDELKTTGWVRMSLSKKIPMGAGMGGGSSNAAAVIVALPALIGKQRRVADWVRMAESLGSDVPFFLYGGTALGVGRGTELYPLPNLSSAQALVVKPDVHVSTAEAYRNLNRSLTSDSHSPILGEFQTTAWDLGALALNELALKNDFEEAVFEAHPELAALVRKLRRLGARPAMMTGSGSALFGIFRSAADVRAAAASFPVGTAFPVRFVTRVQYQRAWRKALGPAFARSIFAR